MASTVTVDDTDPRIVYAIESIPWDASTNWGNYGVFNNTLHLTQEDGSSATLLFKGSSVSVRCLLWLTASNFTATLDNQTYGPFNLGVSDQSAAEPTVAFSKDGLDPNVQHTLVLRKVKTDPEWKSPVTGDDVAHFNIDSITIQGTVITPPTTTSDEPPSASTSTPASSGSKSKPLGLIIGVSIAGVVVLLALVAGLFFYLRRRKKRVVNKTTKAERIVEAFPTPDEPTSTPPRPQMKIKSFGSTTLVNSTATESSGLPAPSPLSVNPTAESEGERSRSSKPSITLPSPTIPSSTPTARSASISAPAAPPLPSAPPMPPIPLSPLSPPPTEFKVPLNSTEDLSSSSSIYPLPSSALSPALDNQSTATRVTASDISGGSTASMLRSEIEGLRQQVQLLQMREAARQQHDVNEFAPYEPPPQYSPRRPGHDSDDEA